MDDPTSARRSTVPSPATGTRLLLGLLLVVGLLGLVTSARAGSTRSAPARLQLTAATTGTGTTGTGTGTTGTGTGTTGTGTGTETNVGYWMATAEGGVLPFGGAPPEGSVPSELGPNVKLAAPVVGMAKDDSGDGYWLVAQDGGVFTFGNAPYLGNTYTIGFTGLTGPHPLAAPIVGIAPTPSGQGYWLVAQDGGVFTFGNAPFEGNTYTDGLTGLGGSNPLPSPVVAMAATPSGEGYWLVSRSGHVWTFGDAPTLGSTSSEVTQPIVALVDAPGDGIPTYSAASPGSYGYDVSNYQCADPLPASTQLGIVETTGWALSAPNPCLQQEAAWAGSNLELYVFLAYGSSSQDQPGCNGNAQCNFGYEAAQYAYQYAQSQGVDVDVPWWVDVEPANWSSNTAANQQVVQGALTYLQDEGVNTVGVYTSPLTWNGLVGNYQPPVPIWLAWYTNNPQGNCQNGVSYAASANNMLPTGGVLVTQYSDQVQVEGNAFDGDYGC